MILVETHIINKNHKFFNECDNLCFLSKNLYNTALYTVNKEYEITGKYTSYNKLTKMLSDNNQQDFRALPAKVSNAILILLDRNFKSYFNALRKYNTNKTKFNGCPQKLKFKNTKNGRNVVIYPMQAISKMVLKRTGLIYLSGTNIELNSKINDKRNTICQVRIVPMNKQYKIEIVYTKIEHPIISDNGKYCGIDVGLNNLFTVAFNNENNQNLIVNGRPLKSINQYYNKQLSQIQSKLEICNKKKTSNKLSKISNKHNNKINDYIHKCTSQLVKELKHNDISKVVIGKNDAWKNAINIGKKNNQNFVSLPHAYAIDVLKYKLELYGIQTIIREESYTSKCSSLDLESISKQQKYLGKRIKRGLFKSNNGTLINADVNGAANILRKEIPTAFANGIEGLVINPIKLKINF